MKRAFIGALGAVCLACVLIFALRAHRARPVVKNHVDIGPLLQALAAAKQPPAAVTSVSEACAAGDACHCVEAAARAALDADLRDAATHMLDAAPRGCPRANTLLGQRAEAFARAAATTSAQQAADSALETNPQNPYAELALARLAYDQNQMAICSDHAAKAVQFGRGVEAERWLGRSALARGHFVEAEANFQHLLLSNPNDAEAAFTAAICDDKLGHYREAREGFLHTLRINPKHELARIYLVVLTHKAGADDEARHHLQKLAEVLPPNSPKLLELQAMLAGDDRDAGAPTNGKPVIRMRQ